MGTDFGNDNAESITKSEIVGRLCQSRKKFGIRRMGAAGTRATWTGSPAGREGGERTSQTPYSYCPSGVLTSVPDGGLNSNVDAGTGERVWFEYVVTIRSPFGKSMSVRSTRKLSSICRSSF